MGCFTVSRAITVRVLFTTHGVFSIWRLYVITGDPQNWYLLLALFGLAFETAFTLYVKRGEDWKWFCPSVFFYLACLVPTIWFLELHELNERIRKNLNDTTSISTAAGGAGGETSQTTISNTEMTTVESEYELRPVETEGGEDVYPDLSDKLEGFIGTSGFDSHQWVRTLEQLLLLILILGRWMLPKGKLTHDQLSQLLLVYIGTAADIVEFFEAFNEGQVKFNRTLCTVILSIWSWSVLQFTLVFTATKARKESPGGGEAPAENCCTPDVFGIIMSIFMQDGPFLVLRMLLIFKYNVLSYTNMFFTCKNTLVCMLLTYRLIVIQIERYQQLRELNVKHDSSSMTTKESKKHGHSSNNPDQYYKYSTKVALKELLQRATTTGKKGDESEKLITYVIKRHMSHASSIADDNHHHHQCSWSRSEFSFNSNDDITTLRGREFSINVSDLEMLPIASYEVGPASGTINHHHRRNPPNGNSNTSCSDSDRLDSSVVVDFNGVVDEETIFNVESQYLEKRIEPQVDESNLNRQIDDVVRLIFGDDEERRKKTTDSKTNDSDSDSSLSAILRVKPPPQILIKSPDKDRKLPYEDSLLSPYYDVVASPTPPPLPSRNSGATDGDGSTPLRTISERVDRISNATKSTALDGGITSVSNNNNNNINNLSVEPVAHKSGLFGRKKLFTPSTGKTKATMESKLQPKFSFKSKTKLLNV